MQNLEEGNLDVYRFGNGNGNGKDGPGGKWDMQGVRLQVNLIAVWGDDVVENMPVAEDDERFLTVELPRRLGRGEPFLFLSFFPLLFCSFSSPCLLYFWKRREELSMNIKMNPYANALWIYRRRSRWECDRGALCVSASECGTGEDRFVGEV